MLLIINDVMVRTSRSHYRTIHEHTVLAKVVNQTLRVIDEAVTLLKHHYTVGLYTPKVLCSLNKGRHTPPLAYLSLILNSY